MYFQTELEKYMNRVLEEELKKWHDGEDPTREDGCYVSPLAYDIIQVQQLHNTTVFMDSLNM